MKELTCNGVSGPFEAGNGRSSSTELSFVSYYGFLFDHRSLRVDPANRCGLLFWAPPECKCPDGVTKERSFWSVVTLLSGHDQLRPADLESPTVLELLTK